MWHYCNLCNAQFPVKKDKVYFEVEGPVGNTMTGWYYEMITCPKCRHQNVLNYKFIIMEAQHDAT